MCEKNTEPKAINLGNDEETTIKDLIYLILKTARVKKEIVFDTTKAEGQPRRNCDTSLLKKIIGFKPQYSLEAGLKETVEYYKHYNLTYEK